jgi:predicted GNAT family acetyltransferase
MPSWLQPCLGVSFAVLRWYRWSSMADNDDDLQVSDNPEQHRYEGWLGEELVGYVAYRLRPDEITLMHTEVTLAAEGRHIGSRLVQQTLDDIRKRGLRVVPMCPFVRGYIKRHPDYADLVRGQA